MDNSQEKLLTIKKGKCGKNVFYNLSNDGTLVISGKGSMDNYNIINYAPWYLDKEKVRKVIIKEGITSIGDGAFANCSSLSDIEISEGVANIGYRAFNGTQWLKNKQKENPLVIINGMLIDGTTCSGNIIVPKDVSSISAGAFEDCKSLVNIEITDNVNSISNLAFYNCKSLINATISDNVAAIGIRAFFGCTNLETIHIPEKVTSINHYTFYGCSNLTSIEFSGNVTNIFEQAFKNCSKLNSISFPNSLISIGDGAFANCSSLSNIEISESVNRIAERAFENCGSLTDVTIKNNEIFIGFRAFGDCTNITNVYFGGSEEDWKSIAIVRGNECLTKANIHFQCKSQQVQCKSQQEIMKICSIEDTEENQSLLNQMKELGYVLTYESGFSEDGFIFFVDSKKNEIPGFCDMSLVKEFIYNVNYRNEYLNNLNSPETSPTKESENRFKKVTEQEAKILTKNGYEVKQKEDSYIVKYPMDDEQKVNTLLKSLNKNIRR